MPWWDLTAAQGRRLDDTEQVGHCAAPCCGQRRHAEVIAASAGWPGGSAAAVRSVTAEIPAPVPTSAARSAQKSHANDT